MGATAVRKLAKSIDMMIKAGDSSLVIYDRIGFDKEFPNIFVCVGKVDIRTLKNPVFQRKIDPLRVENIKKKPSIVRLDPITIAIDDNGDRTTCDGNHRTNGGIAGLAEGYWDDPFVPCKILYNATDAQLSYLFATQDENKKAIDNPSQLKALILAEGENRAQWAVDMNRIVEEEGLTFGFGENRNNNVGKIVAISAIRKAYLSTLDEDNFRRMLRIIRESFDNGTRKNACSGRIIDGLSTFYSEFGEEIDDKLLVKRLKKKSPDTLIDDFNKFKTKLDSKRQYLKPLTDIYNSGKSKADRLDYL
ncbi:hypothetical protein DS742_14310 [Lacrimispora amygdalina]|uniref:DGQHR domain-containing protein n=1 Tax=Lacrimispora amygdalina TaxID=253257 RepID=A0A3E2NBB5_9FIRM|nr:DUF6551 family protein [Clostridium indicum]RFZ78283.1 hypothetical protein DS742_14310 [Clostridium indicum]